MFKTEAALKAAEVLGDQIASVKGELKKLQEECQGEMLLIEDAKHDDLEKEVLELANESEVLKKSAPEVNDDSNIQYFLAIAELEKTNAVLRQQEKITKDNLTSLDMDIDGTNKLLNELKDMKKALTRMKMNNENDPNQGNIVTESQKAKKVDGKIRSTRKIYKEFKTFLGDYLALIDPVDGEAGGNFGNLLQEMWTAFQSKDSEDAYVKMSFLVSSTLFLKKTFHYTFLL